MTGVRESKTMRFDFARGAWRAPLPNRQRGALTIFTAILVLLLMTLMLVYAAQTGVFEQRSSANDVRQKQAFHAAEAAVDATMEYLQANTAALLSSQAGGWFANNRWADCPTSGLNNPSSPHPCDIIDADGDGAPDQTGAFWYDGDGNDTWTNADTVLNTFEDTNNRTTARVSLLLCFVNLNNTLGNCVAAPTTTEEENDAFLLLTVLGYGFSDCTATATPSTCNGEAVVARPVSNYKKLRGAPNVPLTAKSTFPPTGAAEVVANPNGGGVGVPLSVWANDNPSTSLCPNPTSITSSGSWQTCEFQEWYKTDEYPSGTECTINGGCACGQGGNTDDFISYRSGGTTQVGIDIIEDSSFPCDLFEFFFGYPKAAYELVKYASGTTVLNDCTTLDANSSGVIWISGSECRLNANTQYGSPDTPLILISAATNTVLNGGMELFGILYVFDGEDANAELSSTGTATIYGGAIVDAEIDRFQGTFQVVYAEDVLGNAAGLNGIGGVPGGWRDFDLPELAW